MAEPEGRLYVTCGHPAGRNTVRAVQVYDTRTDRWEFGRLVPYVNGAVYHTCTAALIRHAPSKRRFSPLTVSVARWTMHRDDVPTMISN